MIHVCISVSNFVIFFSVNVFAKVAVITTAKLDAISAFGQYQASADKLPNDGFYIEITNSTFLRTAEFFNRCFKLKPTKRPLQSKSQPSQLRLQND